MRMSARVFTRFSVVCEIISVVLLLLFLVLDHKSPNHPESAVLLELHLLSHNKMTKYLLAHLFYDIAHSIAGFLLHQQ